MTALAKFFELNTLYIQQVTLTTDGACVGNPGPGGWAYILRCGPGSREGSGGVRQTTNNRMELQAAIAGFSVLKFPCEDLLISDSTYLLRGLNEWRFAWCEIGWARRTGGQSFQIPNADLWEKLDEFAQVYTVSVGWVKSYSGHPDNERCNDLAHAEAEKYVDLPTDERWPTLSSGR